MPCDRFSSFAANDLILCQYSWLYARTVNRNYMLRFDCSHWLVATTSIENYSLVRFLQKWWLVVTCNGSVIVSLRPLVQLLSSVSSRFRLSSTPSHTQISRDVFRIFPHKPVWFWPQKVVDTVLIPKTWSPLEDSLILSPENLGGDTVLTASHLDDISDPSWVTVDSTYRWSSRQRGRHRHASSLDYYQNILRKNLTIPGCIACNPFFK